MLRFWEFLSHLWHLNTILPFGFTDCQTLSITPFWCWFVAVNWFKSSNTIILLLHKEFISINWLLEIEFKKYDNSHFAKKNRRQSRQFCSRAAKLFSPPICLNQCNFLDIHWKILPKKDIQEWIQVIITWECSNKWDIWDWDAYYWFIVSIMKNLKYKPHQSFYKKSYPLHLFSMSFLPAIFWNISE